MTMQRFVHSHLDTTSTKVFVGGLSWDTTADVLREHFKQYGEIIECVVILDKTTAKSKGYGFVTYLDPKHAAEAVKQPKPIIDHRTANVSLAAAGAKKKYDVIPLDADAPAIAATTHSTSVSSTFAAVVNAQIQHYQAQHAVARAMSAAAAVSTATGAAAAPLMQLMPGAVAGQHSPVQGQGQGAPQPYAPYYVMSAPDPNVTQAVGVSSTTAVPAGAVPQGMTGAAVSGSPAPAPTASASPYIYYQQQQPQSQQHSPQLQAQQQATQQPQYVYGADGQLYTYYPPAALQQQQQHGQVQGQGQAQAQGAPLSANLYANANGTAAYGVAHSSSAFSASYSAAATAGAVSSSASYADPNAQYQFSPQMHGGSPYGRGGYRGGRNANQFATANTANTGYRWQQEQAHAQAQAQAQAQAAQLTQQFAGMTLQQHQQQQPQPQAQQPYYTYVQPGSAYAYVQPQTQAQAQGAAPAAAPAAGSAAVSASAPAVAGAQQLVVPTVAENATASSSDTTTAAGSTSSGPAKAGGGPSNSAASSASPSNSQSVASSITSSPAVSPASPGAAALVVNTNAASAPQSGVGTPHALPAPALQQSQDGASTATGTGVLQMMQSGKAPGEEAASPAVPVPQWVTAPGTSPMAVPMVQAGVYASPQYQAGSPVTYYYIPGSPPYNGQGVQPAGPQRPNYALNTGVPMQQMQQMQQMQHLQQQQQYVYAVQPHPLAAPMPLRAASPNAAMVKGGKRNANASASGVPPKAVPGTGTGNAKTVHSRNGSTGSNGSKPSPYNAPRSAKQPPAAGPAAAQATPAPAVGSGSPSPPPPQAAAEVVVASTAAPAIAAN